MRMKKREKKRGLTTLLMLLLFVTVASAQGLSKKFNVNFKNTPLPSALKTIGKQSGVRVEFAYDDVKSYKVSAHLKSVNAETAVKTVISNHPLTYKVVGGKFIIVSKDASHKQSTPSNEYSQTEADETPTTAQIGKTIRGKVVDEKHEPLPGVSVKCANSRMGTYTDVNGEFSFVLPENHGPYLTFSYIGMQPQKVKLSAKNSNHMQIVMHEDAGALDEVVVTGYQVLDKRSLTSAVTSVKMKDLERADMSSLDQMLEGKVPDLLVSNNSAEVGVAPKIRIRGTSTLIGNREPLWVVDGIVVTDPVAIAPEELNDPDYVNRIGNAISGINPQDIERIDVLKDAAATAIYGTKAANGVIVVTTKRGFEGKPQVSYSANITYKRRPRYSDQSVDMMSSKERIQLSRELYDARYYYDSDATLVGYEKAMDDLNNKRITYYPDRGKTFVSNIDPSIYTSYATWLSSNVPSVTDNLTNTFSTYLSLTYAYKTLWRINLNGRIDGSNKFGDRSNDKFLPIWSLSGSYDLSSLFGKVKWMDYINLKASYGFQGNMLDTESPLMTIRKGTKDTYYNEFVSTIQNHPNPDLKWEKTHSYNVGIDLSLFDHRLEMEMNAYYKKTNDAFMTKKVSSVNGVSSYVINGGDVTNKGYSFDITYNAIRNKDFRWTLSTSISKVINSVDSKPDSQTYDLEDFLDGTAVVEGKAVNTFYSYKFIGLSPYDGGPLFDDYGDNPALLRGLSKYDVFTTVLEASGKRDADIQGSLTNTFRYKNWRASVSLGYSLGAKTRLFAMYGSATSGAAYSSSIYPDKNYSRDYLNRWKQPGDEKHTNIPSIVSYNSEAYYKYCRHWSDLSDYGDIPKIANNYWDMYDYSNIRVVSSDYLKLQSMSLTYEFPMTMLSRIGFQRLAVSASAYNLFCICDPALKGQTPTQGGFSTVQLSDRPSFSLGLNVIF